MQFLVDAQLPPALARWLADKGFTAEHVYDLEMASGTDTEVWHYARTTNAVIITKDEDFVTLATMSAEGPRVVLLRSGNRTKRKLLAWIDRAWPAIVEALNTAERLIEVSSTE
jgi:predicted nuclease of predicted toxin-antitoxin system